MSDQSLENMLWSSSYSCQAEGNSFKFPPGFRFHPTDEELVHHYLKKKVECKRMEIDIIHEIDLYKLEPWDLQDKCKIKGICSEEEENGCYFFCQKGRKYPTGSRTNRATCSGFWKATGRDKPIYNSNHDLIMGMRKTLVFYTGRAPHGHKSDWIMHEYRLQNCSLEEGWVVCKVFRKSCPLTQKSERESSTGSCQYNGIYPHIGMLAGQTLNPASQIMRYPMLSCHSKHTIPIEMPHLESPKNSSNTYASLGLNMPPRSSTIKGIKGIFLGMETQFGNFEKVKNQTTLLPHIIDPCHHQHHASLETMQPNVTDWRVLDRLVASQLSPDDTDSPIDTNIIHNYGNVIDHNDDIYDNNGGGGGDDDGDDGRGNIINDLSFV